MRGFARTFQLCTLQTRINIFNKTIRAIKDTKNTILLSERSFFTDKYVFAKHNSYFGDKLDGVYSKMYDRLWNGVPKDWLCIFLDVKAETCIKRIHTRSSW